MIKLSAKVRGMIIGFISGGFIGLVAGIAVMSLCQAAKERDDLGENYDRNEL